MALDHKYGYVDIRGLDLHGARIDRDVDIPEDEQVVVFRAQDKLLPRLLNMYKLLCWEAGSPQEHLDSIDDAIKEVEDWQHENSSRVKIPD